MVDSSSSTKEHKGFEIETFITQVLEKVQGTAQGAPWGGAGRV